MKTFVAGTPVSAKPQRAASVVVRAAAEEPSRRQLMSLAGLAAIAPAVAHAAKGTMGVEASVAGPLGEPIGSDLGGEVDVPILKNYKSAKITMDRQDDAKDTRIPQNVREGVSQAKQNLGETLSRVKGAKAGLDEIGTQFQKAYWWEVGSNLRTKLGSIRLDLNAIAESKPKAERKKILQLKKDFIKRVEELDYACIIKDKDLATKKYPLVMEAYSSVLAALT